MVAKVPKKGKKVKKEATQDVTEELRHVVILEYHLVHVWMKGETTVCNHWVCGGPDRLWGPPFARSPDYGYTPMMLQLKEPVMEKLGWCKRCHSQQGVIDELDVTAMRATNENDEETLGIISEVNQKCSKGNSVALLPLQTTSTNPSSRRCISLPQHHRLNPRLMRSYDWIWVSQGPQDPLCSS